MAIYGMKDAANMILFDLKTGRPVMFIDYANATSSEWTSEAVYASAKGVRAIRWDGDKQGTLTVDTELFSLELLALVMGSDVEKGTQGVIQRQGFTLDSTRTYDFGTGKNIVNESVFVVPVDEDYVGHTGEPLQNRTSDITKVPGLVNNVVVTPIDKSAKITFGSSRLADAYEVYRDGTKVATVESTSFTDSGLTPETEYKYEVYAINSYGKSAVSPKVIVTTATLGTTTGTPVRATEQDILAAQDGVGELNEASESQASFTVEDGRIIFDSVAYPGEHYAVYFEEQVPGVRKLTIAADKFPSNYGIIADSQIKEKDTGAFELMQIHFKNAQPQPNFTLTQSATEPTSLSITFDLFPKDGVLADLKIID